MKKQCTAKSKQSGKRCKRVPHPGANVCVMHGAGAKQVKRKAAERLAALVDPAIDTLGRLVREKRDKRVAFRASKDVLDRTGHGAPKKIELGGEGFKMSEFQEIDPEALPKKKEERLRDLLDRFDRGVLLTGAEQLELHRLRKKSRSETWIEIRSDQAVIRLPDNGRDRMKEEGDE